MTTVGTRPRGAAALLATPPRALAMTIVAGAAISLQSYLNGRLGGDIGSPTVAAVINNLVATVATLWIVLATGALPRGRAPAGARAAAAVALPGRPRGRCAGARLRRRGAGGGRRAAHGRARLRLDRRQPAGRLRGHRTGGQAADHGLPRGGRGPGGRRDGDRSGRLARRR